MLLSKNRLARNMQVLQVFFLQHLQDLALNLARLALKMKRFLQELTILQELARKNCKIICLQDFNHILQENYLAVSSCKISARFFDSCKKSFIFSASLARFNARKILARLAYFLQDGFYWDLSSLMYDHIHAI